MNPQVKDLTAAAKTAREANRAKVDAVKLFSYDTKDQASTARNKLQMEIFSELEKILAVS